jgi:hypothetical protein
MNHKKNNELKPQYIEWYDAITMQNGWYVAEIVKEWGRTEDWIIKQVGYVIEENKDYILLATKYNPQETEEDKYSEITKIPKSWVKKRANVSFSMGVPSSKM